MKARITIATMLIALLALPGLATAWGGTMDPVFVFYPRASCSSEHIALENPDHEIVVERLFAPEDPQHTRTVGGGEGRPVGQWREVRLEQCGHVRSIGRADRERLLLPARELLAEHRALRRTTGSNTPMHRKQ